MLASKTNNIPLAIVELHNLLPWCPFGASDIKVMIFFRQSPAIKSDTAAYGKICHCRLDQHHGDSSQFNISVYQLNSFPTQQLAVKMVTVSYAAT